MVNLNKDLNAVEINLLVSNGYIVHNNRVFNFRSLANLTLLANIALFDGWTEFLIQTCKY